jgi:hypothetical protein
MMQEDRAMDQLIYVMAILGCADDGSQCERQRIAPTGYQTAASCQAQLEPMLASQSDIPYPTVEVRCEAMSIRDASRALGRAPVLG